MISIYSLNVKNQYCKILQPTYQSAYLCETYFILNLFLFSPSELNDIDSEDETYNKSELENTDEAQMSDLDIKPGIQNQKEFK